jgi:hypothetical protein
MKKHKLRFYEICSQLLDLLEEGRWRPSAKFQWLQNPNEETGDNLNNIRLEAIRHLGIK